MLYGSNTERVRCPEIHRDSLGYSGADHVPDSSAAEIVEEAAAESGRVGRGAPSLAKIPDGLSCSVDACGREPDSPAEPNREGKLVRVPVDVLGRYAESPCGLGRFDEAILG